MTTTSCISDTTSGFSAGTSTGLLTSTFAANQVLGEIINKLDSFKSLGDCLLNEATTQLAALETVAEDAVEGVADVAYDPDTDTVPVSYSAPSAVSNMGSLPAAYIVPSADSSLIDDSVLDAMFDRASARLARISVKDEFEASDLAASMGIGLASESLLARVDAAEQRTNERLSEVALEQTIQEGQWKREDAKTLHQLNIQNWPLRIEQETHRYLANLERQRTNIASEAERRGWSELQMRSALEKAAKDAEIQVQKITVISDVAYRAQEALAQFLVGLTQAVYSAADVGLSGSASQDVNTSCGCDGT